MQTNRPIGGRRLPKKPTKAQLGYEIESTAQQLSGHLQKVYRDVLNLDQEQQTLSEFYLGEKRTNSYLLQSGDNITIGYLGTIDGVPFQGGTSESYMLKNLGSGALIPGFEEQLVNKEVGSTFDIEVIFPENYGNKETAGKKAVFHIVVIAASTPNKLLGYIKDQVQARSNAAAQAKALAEASGSAQ